MPSVALDKATHRGYTNAWRKAKNMEQSMKRKFLININYTKKPMKYINTIEC